MVLRDESGRVSWQQFVGPARLVIGDVVEEIGEQYMPGSSTRRSRGGAIGHARAATRFECIDAGRCSNLLGGLLLCSDQSLVILVHGDLEALERQRKLRDLALDLLGAGSEPLVLELRDPRPKAWTSKS